MIIYAYGSDDEQAIKIGKTTQSLSSRRRQHEGVGPLRRDLHFLMGVVGMDSDETFIHNAFKKHRFDHTSTEWFHANDEVVDWVRWMRSQWFVANHEHEAETIERVPSESWLPGIKDRAVSAPLRLPIGKWGSVSEPDATGDDYYTAPSIIEAARAVMGEIDLDPASHPVANKNVKARRIHTIHDNGLGWPWAGRVWCNPPFGKWESWSSKIVSEWGRGEIDEMCVLLATRALTAKCNAPMLEKSSAMCVLRGRVPFWGPKATASPDDGHVILYFGNNTDAFRRHFSLLGTVYQGATAA